MKILKIWAFSLIFLLVAGCSYKDEIEKSHTTIMDKDDYPHVRASIKQ